MEAETAKSLAQEQKEYEAVDDLSSIGDISYIDELFASPGSLNDDDILLAVCAAFCESPILMFVNDRRTKLMIALTCSLWMIKPQLLPEKVSTCE